MAFVSFNRCSREVRSSAGALGGFAFAAAGAAGGVPEAVALAAAGAPAVDGVADFGCSDLLADGGFCLGPPAVDD